MVAQFPEVTAVIYNYFVINGQKYPGQITISGTSGEEGTFAAAFIDTVKAIIADVDESTVVVYEPREVSGGFKSSGGSPAASDPPATLPPASGQICAIHNVAWTQKNGKFGTFESCPEKNADNSWCRWKPQ